MVGFLEGAAAQTTYQRFCTEAPGENAFVEIRRRGGVPRELDTQARYLARSFALPGGGC
jgi:hypothetical protein